MGELEHLPLAQEYALLHALFQKAQYLVLMHTTHRAKGLHGETMAQEGCQSDDPPTALTEPLGASGDRICNMLGKPQVRSRGRGHYVATTLLERLLLQEVVEYLLDEQGVALCRFIDGSYKLM